MKIGKYNANERVKVSKLKNDFQKLLKQYEILLGKVRNMHNQQMSELIVKSKRTSCTTFFLLSYYLKEIFYKICYKKQIKNKLVGFSLENELNRKISNLHGSDDIVQEEYIPPTEAEFFNQMILEKEREIKGNSLNNYNF